MDQHRWVDPKTEISYTVTERNATGDSSTQAALCRELLRLAGRVKELEAKRLMITESVARIRRELLAEMDGPGVDWSDIDQVQALIDRICPEAPR